MLDIKQKVQDFLSDFMLGTDNRMFSVLGQMDRIDYSIEKSSQSISVTIWNEDSDGMPDEILASLDLTLDSTDEGVPKSVTVAIDIYKSNHKHTATEQVMEVFLNEDNDLGLKGPVATEWEMAIGRVVSDVILTETERHLAANSKETSMEVANMFYRTYDLLLKMLGDKEEDERVWLGIDWDGERYYYLELSHKQRLANVFVHYDVERKVLSVTSLEEDESGLYREKKEYEIELQGGELKFTDIETKETLPHSFVVGYIVGSALMHVIGVEQLGRKEREVSDVWSALKDFLKG